MSSQTGVDEREDVKPHKGSIIPLLDATRGQRVRIVSMPNGALRAQFIRLGLHEGEKATCFERLPGGTIVLQKNRQLIAVGHILAKEILVLLLGAGE